jgi:dihydrodipicolinate synthase/N-acetylneuraminate lyase
MTPTTRLAGIYTPNVVPLDDRGEIHEAELRRYVDWLIQRGVHGLYPNGSTGEFTRFTAEERRRIIEIIADQTAGRVPVLAGRRRSQHARDAPACEHYHRVGLSGPWPSSRRSTTSSAPAGVYAYFKEIADNTPVDVTLYNIPMFASPIDVPTVQRLAEECPRSSASRTRPATCPT